jgi:hypothetical protein
VDDVLATLVLDLVVWAALFASPTPQAGQAASPQVWGNERSRAAVSTRSPHGNLTIPCQNCHTFTGWKPIRNVPEFDHNQTKYPLRGLHQKVACRQCHTDLVFSNVSTKCADCHADIHRRQFGAACEQCHTVNGWRVSVNQIKQHQNRFPLIGAHAALECDACHTGAAVGRFQGLSTDCVSCHLNQFKQTTGPSHVALNFPTQCQQCHNSMDTWLGAKFDHLRFTGFALVGAHAKLECTQCHIGGKYQGTPADCVGCHIKDYAGAKNPDHVKLAFPTSCSTCHNTTTWLQVNFNHGAFTGFPLTGAHVNVPCTSCHVNNNYTNIPKDCAGCHLKDYQKTTNPNHAQVGFPTDCSICHSTVTWLNATFDHSKTGFALTGAHAHLQCQACHGNGQFTKLNPACATCHLKDYQGTNNPPHLQVGFPTTCEVCHSTSAWQPATFDHNKTKFPLTGFHVKVPCASCHINNNYVNTPTDCYSCHKADYLGTNNPNHVAAQFPTTCALCHNTSTWLGATFNHTWFPIYSGTHAGTWTTCGDCHTNPSNYAVFSCITCHAHEKTRMDQAHQDVRNYVYNSANCYACHPTGQGGG